jgi:uracil-DNA glycosylase
VASNDIEINNISSILNEVRSCQLCTNLALGPNPILQLNSKAKILIAGQAPGKKTHYKNIPFDDPSGERLRDWMGINRDTFYDESSIAILPMAFCYPGTGKSGDLPPPSICTNQWREKLLDLLPNVELTLVIGQYALDWHLGNTKCNTLTETVKQWQKYWPDVLPMPHPSPRNNIWLKKNPWYLTDVLPELKKRVASLV